MKDIYIADLADFDEGKLFDSFFLVLAKQQRTTKTNKPYLNLILGDKTGQLEGRVWEPGDPRIAKDFDRGDIVKARGSASRFDDRLQMKVDQLRKAAPGEVDKSRPAALHHLRRGRRCGASSWQAVESFTNPDLKRLLTTLLADPAWPRPTAKRLPPGSFITPGWAGCWSTSSACSPWPTASPPHYPLLDRDLLITGVILHDIGKIRELSWEIGFDYTIEGMLLGHIQMGVDLVEKTIDSLPEFPTELRDAGAAHDPVAPRQAGVRLAQAAHDSRGAGAELPRRPGRQDAGHGQRVRKI